MTDALIIILGVVFFVWLCRKDLIAGLRRKA